MKRWIIAFLWLGSMLFADLTLAEETILSNAEQVFSASTTVMLVLENRYEVSISPSVPMVYGEECTDFAVCVESLDLLPKYVLQIAVESPEGALQAADGEGTIPYTLISGQETFKKSTFDSPGEAALSVVVDPEDWFNAPAGTYEGKLTFSVAPMRKDAKGGD